jgi:hypothetical protein
MSRDQAARVTRVTSPESPKGTAFFASQIAFDPPTVASVRTGTGGPSNPGIAQAISPPASVLQAKIAIDAKHGTAGFCDMAGFKAHGPRLGKQLGLGPTGLVRQIVECAPITTAGGGGALIAQPVRRGKGVGGERLGASVRGRLRG